MGKQIVFIDATGKVPEAFYPTPAKMAIPEWIKNLHPYYNNNGKEGSTAKRCLPLLDAVMFGYTIYTTADIRITQNPNGTSYEWPHGLGINFHDGRQIETHKKTNYEIPKWMNPWAIKTPPGYSILFVEPLNSDNNTISIFSGVVDSDKYVAQTNLPFILSDSKFQGIIEAGTPIAQVIPFRRESWSMKIERGQNSEIEESNEMIARKFKNSYRFFFRAKKSFN